MRSPLALLLALLTTACGDDLYGESAADSDSDASADADDDPGPTPDGPPPPVAPECERYMACVRVAEPERWAASKLEYGPGGDCWLDNLAEANDCIAACESGVAELHRQHPAVKACMQCQTDGECDTYAGEFCFAGGCESVTCQGDRDGASCP